MAARVSGSDPDQGPDRPGLEETIAQSGPGIPDDSASPGYDPAADAEAEREVEADPPTAETLFRRD